MCQEGAGRVGHVSPGGEGEVIHSVTGRPYRYESPRLVDKSKYVSPES